MPFQGLKEPVQGTDKGVFYEKAELVNWVSSYGIDPRNNPMDLSQIVEVQTRPPPTRPEARGSEHLLTVGKELLTNFFALQEATELVVNPNPRLLKLSTKLSDSVNEVRNSFYSKAVFQMPFLNFIIFVITECFESAY